jgi:predicted ribosome quality control (RQC) complex YloA/Tae2 family protein
MMPETHELTDPAEALKKDLAQMISVAKRALKRVRVRLLKQEEELIEASQYSRFTQIADSLLAHPERIDRGASTCNLENIHTQKEEKISLDPAISVFENAKQFYTRAKKGKRGLSIIEKKVKETRDEESSLAVLLEELEQVRTRPPAEAGEREIKVSAAREKLRDLGVLPKQQAKKAAEEAESVPYRRLTIDGWDIFIGKNDTQNDELTTRFAKPWDIWMHVAACAGSHVVVRREKNAPWPPKEVLVKAASLSVWFSKAKHTSYADVDITEARFVHKRRRAPPGEVIAERCKTLRVPSKSPQDFFPGDFDK